MSTTVADRAAQYWDWQWASRQTNRKKREHHANRDMQQPRKPGAAQGRSN